MDQTKDHTLYEDEMDTQFDHLAGTYEGEWRNNQRDGFGKSEFSNNCTFEGVYSKDKIVKGKFNFSDGTEYDGEFNNKIEFHGVGKMKRKNLL